ncbi:hypothetical protein BpHYR1_009381 [Brachionus plicatilis]|uniref:Uncharacterized protein n=1 Tax=Brachionus plicatilis TaxID=10195 RepID=A0A3M7Q706_BRAPC|nr:hypothetical protein BpHYR1_009381 [Brachionus plicatilis]
MNIQMFQIKNNLNSVLHFFLIEHLLNRIKRTSNNTKKKKRNPTSRSIIYFPSFVAIVHLTDSSYDVIFETIC